MNEVLEELFMYPNPRREGMVVEYPREMCHATVHIDVPAAQSGVSRYMENRCGFWKYSKEEELSDEVGCGCGELCWCVFRVPFFFFFSFLIFFFRN